eukprot:gb/GECG01007765.1/.p1 GENE.gb/GECG01007765.1/~~gb/GECG01007765.1/.p1  ORF type:complete len:166 (+),score=6.80 gb/GECG01007765.1/:1-498(+)
MQRREKNIFQFPKGYLSRKRFATLLQIYTLDLSAPTCCTESQVTSISCGWEHSFARTAEGKLFGWGSNKHGQLGIGFSERVVPTPTEVELPIGNDHKVTDFCGGFSHSLFLVNNEEIFACGNNRFLQLGQKIEGNQTVSLMNSYLGILSLVFRRNNRDPRDALRH